MTAADRLSLAPASASPSAARRWLADQLAGYPESVVAGAALLVSEVVTNAVLHAGTTIEVAVHAREGVHVEVADGSSVLPNAKDYVAEAATGRGLMLLEAMATAWGVEVRPPGKVVWFDMAAPVGSDMAEVDVANLTSVPGRISTAGRSSRAGRSWTTPQSQSQRPSPPLASNWSRSG